MRFYTAIFAAIVFALPTLPSPLTRPTHEFGAIAGPTTGKYIIRVDDEGAKARVLNKLSAKARSQVTHNWDLIHGFAGAFDTATLEVLRSSIDVKLIEQDDVAHTTVLITQTNAPWGISRLSSSARLSGSDSSLTFNYTYDTTSGAGVDIYVVDTGIFTSHTQFGGRARWGTTFGGYASADGNGHGTHCSGTAAGSQFGVAKAANLVAVKVLNDGGSGAWTDVISGLDWVGTQATASGRPSIVSMSLGGRATQSVDDAVNALAAQGVHVVVAAGNANSDASTFSPARATGAITIAASDITDTKASFSNYGAPVAIWAPGVNVISSWIGSDTATNEISGTSMATPHVSGLIAYLIGLEGNISPVAMKSKIQSLGSKNVVSGVPSGTVNILAHNA